MPPLEGKATKRKGTANSTSLRKRPKLLHSAEDLPWKSVSLPLETGFGGDDGILGLEEVDDVEVFYEETEGGRVVKFNVLRDATEIQKDDAEDNGENSSVPLDVDIPATEDLVPEFDTSLLPDWQPYSLHTQLLAALHSKGYTSPTPIQAAALPIAFAERDIVGVAQTGSGKTLAYGLPILHHLLQQPKQPLNKRRCVKALILAPTRELALQVSTHLIACLNSSTTINGQEAIEGQGEDLEENSAHEVTQAKPTSRKPPPHVSVTAIVGGISIQKQKRVLERGVDVIVATPGRLWDILETNDTLTHDIRHLRFLVIDEADRMIEGGHFAELDNVLRLTMRQSKDERIPDDAETSSDEEPKDTTHDAEDVLQTFVYSATLSKDLQRNLKKRFKPKSMKKYHKNSKAPATTLDDLLMRLDFRDPEPEVIDLSPAGNVVSTLQEGKVECLSTDKDVYLYYFFMRYPGRTLVFLSSIDGIRRLLPIVELLNIKAFPLHSQMEQRQRLKNLDRFRNTKNCILLATDIAARGLDIPAVDHVVHFQIPRTADTYVHRNGRTARAMNKGFSMLMCAPDERRVLRALLHSLKREESEISEMSIELGLMDKLKARVQLARQIDNSHHKIKKANHDRNWMKETAEVLGVDLDSDYASDPDEDTTSNRKRKIKDAKVASMKAQLKQLLSQPLLARGISARYITYGNSQIAEDLLSGKSLETMLGLRKAEAGSDMVTKKKKNNQRDDEEWSGITLKL